jgi:hypothetical protein
MLSRYVWTEASNAMLGQKPANKQCHHSTMHLNCNHQRAYDTSILIDAPDLTHTVHYYCTGIT